MTDKKIQSLIEIMFEEDEERYTKGEELMYHTEEEFLEEKKEKSVDKQNKR